VGPVYLASDPSLAATTGEYFSGTRPDPGSPASRDDAAANRLFARCEEYGHGG
jgi:hypothetical protein